MNWFAVSHKWNNKKHSKWDNFQPVLSPLSKDLENRLIYDKDTATYFWKNEDKEAENLIHLLDLNNEQLAKERQNKIILLKTLFGEQNGQKDFIKWISHPKSKKDLIEFRRAIEVVFDIKLEN